MKRAFWVFLAIAASGCAAAPKTAPPVAHPARPLARPAAVQPIPASFNPAPSVPPPSGLALGLVRTAKSYLGSPDAASEPQDGTDFVARVFLANGLTVPRTPEELSLAGRRVASLDDLQTGDIVFFSSSPDSRIVNHVGIYISDGVFIHFVNPTIGVVEESLDTDFYRSTYLTSRRVLP